MLGIALVFLGVSKGEYSVDMDLDTLSGICLTGGNDCGVFLGDMSDTVSCE